MSEYGHILPVGHIGEFSSPVFVEDSLAFNMSNPMNGLQLQLLQSDADFA